MSSFVDRAIIKLKSGNGGNGCVSFHREKYVQNGGPDGGDGGKGGNIILKADPNMHTLLDFRYKTKYHAENGESGQSNFRKGKDGEDLVIKLPVGTVVIQRETNSIVADLYKPNMEKILLKGGRGGYGNPHFASSTRQAPNFAKPGLKTKEIEFVLELKTIADVGLVGFPNVGKSTILAALTRAKPKIANYHFTTLTPNLGIVQKYDKSFVLADIPGLVEGASEGVGLGHHFLRHVERTKLILNVIDASGSEGRDPKQDYDTIRHELENYGKLAQRQEIVVLNKADIISDESYLNELKEYFENKGLHCFVISAASHKGLDKLVDCIIKSLDSIGSYDMHEEENEVYIHSDSEPFVVEKIEDDLYEISGDGIDRLVSTVNFNDDDSINWFHKMLRKHMIIDRLKELGAKEGDSIIIGEMEFDFID